MKKKYFIPTSTVVELIASNQLMEASGTPPDPTSWGTAPKRSINQMYI